jgi:hypothetical protein
MRDRFFQLRFNAYGRVSRCAVSVVLAAFAAQFAAGCGPGVEDAGENAPGTSGGDAPDGAANALPAVKGPPYVFRAGSDGFEVLGEGGAYRPFWPMGVNYSHAIPGTSPGEFLASREQIASWIAAMADLGVNAVRIYTVQSPIFYEELRRHNLEHPEKPLFLLQGAWLKEPAEDPALEADPDYLCDDIKSWFKDEIEKVVDVVHGHRDIPEGSPENPQNYGRAFGEFTADVSPWLLGWLVGREVEPLTIMATHDKYYAAHCGGAPCTVDYAGENFSIVGGTPIEAFITENLDHLARYEEDHYGEQHAIGFSNWPMLDPMKHPVDPGWPDSTEDVVQLDLLAIEVHPRFERGLFFSYHVYPYDPEFILHQPDYQVNDDKGPNSYLGYLKDLRAHYAGRTLLIAEIGHPSSQGSAHYAKSGLTHGGLNEVEQGEAVARSLRTIARAELDGAFLFELIDEWFKRAWIVDRVELPAERRRLWYNAMSPEQNFGLLAMRPGWPEDHHTLDGKGDDFIPAPQAAQEGPPLAPLDADEGMRTLRALTLDGDAGFLHMLLNVEDIHLDGGKKKIDWSRVDYLFAIDTFEAGRGDGCLDPACTLGVERRVEFLLRVDSEEEVTLLVDRPYDMFGVWHLQREPWQLYHTEKNDDGLFNVVRTITNNPFLYDGKLISDRIVQKTGVFRAGPEGEESSSNLWYSIEEGTIEIRIPWNLLNVTDPSSRRVIDDFSVGPKKDDLTTASTPEIAVVVAALGGKGEKESSVVDTLPRAAKAGARWVIPASGAARYTLPTWDADPAYHEYRKRSFDILKDELPDIAPESARVAP